MLHQSSAFKRIHWLGCVLAAFLRMKADMLVAAAAPCQRRAAAPAPAAMATGIYLHHGRSAEAPSRTDAVPKRRKPLPHLLLWSRGEGLPGTATERPPSFPPLPPRNCLSVQFLPHVSVSHTVPVHPQLDAVSPPPLFYCSVHIWLPRTSASISV